MSETSVKLGLQLPDEEEFYEIGVFNENFRKIDEAHELFEDCQCSISTDGNTLIESYESGVRITQINDAGTQIVESVYDKSDVLIEKFLTTIQGNMIQETKVQEAGQ